MRITDEQKERANLVNLPQFLMSRGFDLKKVTLARIGKILMDTGLVNDYENLTLNGQSASVHISDEQLPVCGVVSLNVIS